MTVTLEMWLKNGQKQLRRRRPALDLIRGHGAGWNTPIGAEDAHIFIHVVQHWQGFDANWHLYTQWEWKTRIRTYVRSKKSDFWCRRTRMWPLCGGSLEILTYRMQCFASSLKWAAKCAIRDNSNHYFIVALGLHVERNRNSFAAVGTVL